jgi:hypothetical protein
LQQAPLSQQGHAHVEPQLQAPVSQHSQQEHFVSQEHFAADSADCATMPTGSRLASVNNTLYIAKLLHWKVVRKLETEMETVKKPVDVEGADQMIHEQYKTRKGG